LDQIVAGLAAPLHSGRDRLPEAPEPGLV
jgi:hypothetical protein